MPTQKSQVIEDFLTSIAGISRQDAAAQGICTKCKQSVSGFRNRESVKEYQISGMCQECQDEMFGVD